MNEERGMMTILEGALPRFRPPRAGSARTKKKCPKAGCEGTLYAYSNGDGTSWLECSKECGHHVPISPTEFYTFQRRAQMRLSLKHMARKKKKNR